MSDARRDRSIKILIGIGLIVIGVGAGMLAMLLMEDRPDPAQPLESRIVERVQLGRSDRAAQMPNPDSAALSALQPQTLNTLFRQVADHVTPAVVYIQVEVPVSRDGGSEWPHYFDEESSRRFFRDRPLRQSVGSGVLVSEEGYIATNYHVVQNAENIEVTLSDKRLYEARVIGTDPSTDLAVIKIEDGAGLPVVALGNSDDVEVGEWVIAVGNPFRLTSTVTAGIVSALGRQVNIIDDNFRIEDFIQTDAAINPGNSGGALVNLRGELVGIATAIATESGSYEGYGFAVPVNLMERVVQDLIEYGEVQRGFLGIEIQDIDARVARRLGMDRIMGVYVNSVTRNGAAAAAGLNSGDVLLTIDGRPVDAPNELQSAVARRRPGDIIDVTLWRQGDVQSVEVTLLGRDAPAYERWFTELRQEEAAPAPAPTDPRSPESRQDNLFELSEWGIGLRDLSRQDRSQFDVEAGVYLAYVENGSLADEAGLPHDVVVTEVAGEAVGSSEDAVKRLEVLSEMSESILLRVKRRDGMTAFYEIEAPVPAG